VSATDRIGYYAYRCGSRIVQLLPGGFAQGVGDGAGRVMARRNSDRRRQIERNMRRVLGDLSDAELRRRVEDTFRNYARYWVELFRLPVTSRPLDARMTSYRFERIYESIERGQGTILAGPHVGCWDYAGAWMVEIGIPVVVVVEPLEPRELFEWFLATRQELGMEVIELGPAAGAEVTRALNDNRVVGLVCDRDLTNDGIDVEFFGEQTTMPAGPAILALRTGATLLPAAGYFHPDGMHHVVTSEPIEVVRTGGRLREDVTRVTQLLASRLEELIRVAPDQWFVFQPHWPSDNL